MLLDVLVERLDIELQRTTDLDRGNLPQPRLLVDRVYFEIEVLGGLPHIQEPPTDDSI